METNTDTFASDLVSAYKAWAEWGKIPGVVSGCSGLGVQLSLALFTELFRDYTVSRWRHGDAYPYELSTTYDGVKIFCIVTIDEAIDLGLIELKEGAA